MGPIAGAPLLHIRFAGADELLAAWARHVAEGAIFIPTHARPDDFDFRVSFHAGETELEGQVGRRVERPGPPGQHGVWLEITPTPALTQFIDLRARERRAARMAAQNRRAEPRLATQLEVRFDDLSSLRAQYTSDISRGGLFVCCEHQPDLRARVEVTLVLPNREFVRVQAEVVHRIVTGARAGVGLQFLEKNPPALEPLIALLQEREAKKKRVLVVDDEAIWRSTLSRALTGLGVEVILASDGRDGLVKLIEGFFDLDLVILDLHMPHIDGRGLIERVRKNGGEQTLKMVLFSAASPEELEALGEPGLATAVYSKLDSIDSLISRIRAELELT